MSARLKIEALAMPGLYDMANNRIQLAREYALVDRVDASLDMLAKVKEADLADGTIQFDMACVYSLCANSLSQTSLPVEDRQTESDQMARRALELLNSDATIAIIAGIDFEAQLGDDLAWLLKHREEEIQRIRQRVAEIKAATPQ